MGLLADLSQVLPAQRDQVLRYSLLSSHLIITLTLTECYTMTEIPTSLFLGTLQLVIFIMSFRLGRYHLILDLFTPCIAQL